MGKMETGKCTRIQRITTMEQTELYRKLLYKGLDARKIIKQVASGKRNLTELHTEISKLPNCKPAPPVAAASSSSGGSSSLVKYADSGDSRSPSPELKRKRSDRTNSPQTEKKKKSRY